MVTKCIVLGRKIYVRGIKVDKSKVWVIEKLSPLINLKGIKSFLVRTIFYKRFIKEFSKNENPISNLLIKYKSLIF